MGHILLYFYETSLCKDKQNETDLVRQFFKLKIKYDKIKEAVQDLTSQVHFTQFLCKFNGINFSHKLTLYAWGGGNKSPC